MDIPGVVSLGQGAWLALGVYSEGDTAGVLPAEERPPMTDGVKWTDFLLPLLPPLLPLSVLLTVSLVPVKVVLVGEEYGAELVAVVGVTCDSAKRWPFSAPFSRCIESSPLLPELLPLPLLPVTFVGDSASAKGVL